MYNSSLFYNAIETGFGIITIIVLFVYIFSTAFLGRWVAEKKDIQKTLGFGFVFFPV